jgi:hypothetical protein
VDVVVVVDVIGDGDEQPRSDPSTRLPEWIRRLTAHLEP